jgi:CRISPR/Cas system-associated exonuclease Cas4 (RecB family)
MQEIIRQEINGLRHYLDPDRLWVPSVTAITGRMLRKDGLTAWKARNVNHKTYARDEAVLGSLKHLRILQRYVDEDLELVDLPGVDWVTEDRLDQLEIAEVMWDSMKLEVGWPRRVEHTLYRREHPRCAGSLDMLAQLHAPDKWAEGLSLTDIKSSKSPQEGHKYQLGAYYIMLPKELRDATKRGLILCLHTQIANNPTLQPTITELQKKELEWYGQEFLKLAAEFWRLYEGDVNPMVDNAVSVGAWEANE